MKKVINNFLLSFVCLVGLSFSLQAMDQDRQIEKMSKKLYIDAISKYGRIQVQRLPQGEMISRWESLVTEVRHSFEELYPDISLPEDFLEGLFFILAKWSEDVLEHTTIEFLSSPGKFEFTKLLCRVKDFFPSDILSPSDLIHIVNRSDFTESYLKSLNQRGGESVVRRKHLIDIFEKDGEDGLKRIMPEWFAQREFLIQMFDFPGLHESTRRSVHGERFLSRRYSHCHSQIIEVRVRNLRGFYERDRTLGGSMFITYPASVLFHNVYQLVIISCFSDSYRSKPRELFRNNRLHVFPLIYWARQIEGRLQEEQEEQEERLVFVQELSSEQDDINLNARIILRGKYADSTRSIDALKSFCFTQL